MHTLFSSRGMDARKGFRLWREVLGERLIPIEVRRLDEDSPFQAKLDVAEIGAFRFSRMAQSALRCETTPAAAKHRDKAGMVVVVFKLAGMSTSLQDSREAVQRPGDMVVLDHRPSVVTTHKDSQALFLELPRERLEDVLGSTRLYAGLSVEANLGSTKLVTGFIRELIRVRHQLTPETAERMTAVGGDLIVASIAERLAQEPPRPVYGTLVVQRAKAHIEANLSDLTLDPPQLAAAVGVSLRRLQELFHERGRHISGYIWERRLETAAKRLADTGLGHLSMDMMAYACGFKSQSHFSRRFKERFGMSPTDFRASRL